MSFVRALVLAALATVSCADDPIIPLVQLSGIAPRQVELGDKLEIDGEAFPQGRKARVTFAGTFHRPGEATDADASVELQGDVAAPDRIEIGVTDAAIVAFCGAGATATHTTFEGSVTVVFAAQQVGAPPVLGNLQHVILDVLPTAAGQARYIANAEDGDRLARTSGIRVESRAAGGLVVTAVEPGSRAARAGFVPDDVIVASNGVRAIGIGDLAPPSGTALSLRVQRSGGTEETLGLPLDEARSEAPRFAAPAVLVGGVALLLTLLAASPGVTIVWLRRRLAARPASSARLSMPDAVAMAVGLVTAATIPVFVPSADVGLLALVLFTGALAMALLVGAESEDRTWRALVLVASRIGPVAVGLAGALTLAGSLRANELTAAQGAAFWGFFAVRSPAHALLAFVCCTWPAGGWTPIPAKLRLETFFGTLHAGLVVLVFFGGWRLPLVPPNAHGELAWVLGAWFVAKTVLIATLVRRVRTALPSRSLGAIVHAAWLRWVPLGLAASLGAALWERHVTARGVGAATAFGLTALAAGLFVQLAWIRPTSSGAVPGARSRVDPLA